MSNIIKPNTDKTYYDLISLGEVMLRLDPGDMRVKTTRQFKASEGGGEYNVARGLRKCFNLHTAIVTALVDNDIGYLIEDLIMTGGVDTRFIKWLPFDGIGVNARNGLNFTERGFGVRNALGIQDRGHSAASLLRSEDIDWEEIFELKGSKWFHTGGIFAGLSPNSREIIIEGAKYARKNKTIISYDLNYRQSLWSLQGGKDAAAKTNKEIINYVDVLFGNEEDFYICLDYKSKSIDNNYTNLDKDNYINLANRILNDYKNIKIVATTLRTVHSASINSWQALCVTRDQAYISRKYDNLLIFDRVGGGDSFATGFIYGILTGKDLDFAVNCGAAHGALAMTTPGDTSMASLPEVLRLMEGESARVIR